MTLTLALLCIALAVYAAVCNLIGVCGAVQRKRRGVPGGYSCVAFFSIIFAGIAYWLAGDILGYWAFVPSILDPGTWVAVSAPVVLPWMWFNHRA